MKQKKLTRKERKQARDAELARRGIDPEARRARANLGGARPFLTRDDTEMEETALAFLTTVFESDSLAGEPEFAEMLIDPMTAVEAFVEVHMELGLEPDYVTQYKGEELEEMQLDIMDKVTERLLSKDVRRQLKRGIDDIILRLNTSHDDMEKLAQADAVRILMREAKTNQAWTGIGLVQTIVQRSVEAGMALARLQSEPDLDHEHIGETLRKLQKPGAHHPFLDAAKRIPGLQKLMEKQVDEVWEKGEEELMTGQLALHVFTQDEVKGMVSIMKSFSGPDETGDADDSGDETLRLTDEKGSELITQLADYMTNLLTPARMDQLRDALTASLDAGNLSELETQFVGLMFTRLGQENAVEFEMPLLIHMMLNHVYELEAEDESDDDAPT